MTAGREKPITVMLVDDSAVIRGMMTKILSDQPDILIVKSISDGDQAVKVAADLKPDVIILDIEMPVMDGMTALPKLLQVSPGSKVVMCSTLTLRNAQITLEALRLGATECIAKPSTPRDIQDGGDFQRSLIAIVRGLGGESMTATSPSPAPVPAKGEQKITLHTSPGTYYGRPALLAIGSSTGGPQALFTVLSYLKGIGIPVVITQHMPPTFTKMLAQHISNHSGVPAVEAENDMEIENGVIYVAPGGFHMLLRRNAAGKTVVALDTSPPVNFCKPAVDPMLLSAVDLFGNKVMGLILTGMGHDGLEGAKKLVSLGGRLIAQDKESSVVWGMPGAVAEAGLCSEILPLQDIGPWLRRTLIGI
jgi:two-component system chemotaxis response regulator CheB